MCGWCGEQGIEEILRGTWARGGSPPIRFTVVRCVACGLDRTDPVPDVRRYARGESTWSGGAGGDIWSGSIAQALIERAPGPRILDIGCNVGNVVEAAARLGSVAEGIDLDPVAIDRGRARGRNIHNRTIADQTGSWDGILLNHVLEHIADLREFLAHVDGLSAPGGVVQINVPCHRGVVPRLMGDHWFAWAPDEHVWHFTPRTLRQVVESSTSLRAVTIRQKGVIEPPSAGVKGRAKRVAARLASSANRGDQIDAIFAKPR